MKSRMRAREMTIHAPAEFQLHRRRRRDERFGEKIDKAPPSKSSYLTFALIAHTATRDDVIDARVDERERILVCFPRASPVFNRIGRVHRTRDVDSHRVTLARARRLATIRSERSRASRVATRL